MSNVKEAATMALNVTQTVPIYGSKCMEVIDPFGNRLRINEALEKRGDA